MIETRPVVSRMLDEGFRATADKWLVLQLSRIRKAPHGDRKTAELLDLVFSLVSGFRAAEIVAHATPFFWHNVIRLHNHLYSAETDKTAETIRSAATALAVSAIDSYLPHTPARTVVDFNLPPRGRDHCCFPALGRRIPLTPSGKFEHAGGQAIRYSGKSIEEYEKIRIPIPDFPECSLLTSNSADFFDDDYRHKIDPESPNVDNLSRMIQSSLNTIEIVDPVFGRRLTSLVRWYVPLFSTDFRVHNSFSASTLFGVIFLSDAYNSLRLAEAIVHEFHHNELYMLMAVEELFVDNQTDLFYSPWRQDPRPLTGLIHALHVFSNVKRFLEAARDIPGFASIREELVDEIRRLNWQIQIGIWQVPREQLKEGGLRILDDIIRAVEKNEALDPMPESVVRHIDCWRSENRDLNLNIFE